MDLTPFQKLLVARVFREQPASRALFEDFVSNQLRLGDCRMSADEIDATDKSDASFQRSAAIAEAHEHEMVLNGTHPRYIGYGGEGRALHVEPAPEIPVTAEMIVAGKEAARVIGVAKGSDQLSVVYRAMAAVAPRDTYMSGLPFVAAKDARIAALEAENAELKARSAMLKAEGRGLQRTWDSLCASYRAEIRDLKTENAATRDELAQRLGPLIAADLPDPPRRPDGTLVPQPKPLPMLTTHGPSRRVGG